jgi:hypothetical protein
MGFGKQVETCPETRGRTWRKTSYGMMREFLEQKGMQVMKLSWRDPEFAVYGSEYEEYWARGRPGIGGQQAEEWESPAWNRCEEGIGKMIEVLQGSRKR